MASLGDVVIGYHADDLEFVKKLVSKLRASDLSVWYHQSGDDGKKTSEAILGCKVYLPILTEVSAVDKSIQEQLSLAYISNSAIYPLGKIPFHLLAPKLNGGSRLMLAKINWSFILKEEHFEPRTDLIIECIKKDIKNIEKILDPSAEESGYMLTHGMCVPISISHMPNSGDQEPEFVAFSQGIDLSSISQDTPFWDRHFKGNNEIFPVDMTVRLIVLDGLCMGDMNYRKDLEYVTWIQYRDKFLQDYGEKIVEGFSDNAEERKKLFVNLMYKDVFLLSKIVKRSVYDKFCGKPHPHAFFTGMQDYVMAYTSLREVLSMDSSLRISTIQNLGSFQFPAIVSGLSDMLKDEDPNVRAVAAIALAHAGKKIQSTADKIIGLLEDEDRLVRESACLSLGYLRSTRAVTHVVDRWRNDPISTVREAAELALSRMDAPDAVQCMKVTKVLSSEMNALKPEHNTKL